MSLQTLILILFGYTTIIKSLPKTYCTCPYGYEPLPGTEFGDDDGHDDDNGYDDDDNGNPSDIKPTLPKATNTNKPLPTGDYPHKPVTTNYPAKPVTTDSFIWQWTTKKSIPNNPPKLEQKPVMKTTQGRPFMTYPPMTSKKPITTQKSPPIKSTYPQPPIKPTYTKPIVTKPRPTKPIPTIPIKPVSTKRIKPWGDGDEYDEQDDIGGDYGIDGDSPDGCICVPSKQTTKALPVCYDGWAAWDWCGVALDCPVGYFCDANGGCCPELPWKQGQQSLNDNSFSGEINYYYSNHKTTFILIVTLMSLFIIISFIILIYSIFKNKKEVSKKLIENTVNYNSVQLIEVQQ